MGRKSNRPNEVSHLAPAAAVQEAAEPPYADGQRDRRGQHIDHAPHGELVAPRIVDENECSGHHAAIEHHATAPGFEKIKYPLKLARVANHKEQPGPDHAPQKNP